MTIRVLIVDDDITVRRTLARPFSRQPDFQVVGEAADGEEALVLTAQQSPDVIVMDVQMPKLSGLEATAQLRSQGVDTPILFLTADTTATIQARRLGHVRLLMKADVTMADTVGAVRELSLSGLEDD